MTDNRLRLKFEPQLTPVRLEDRMDLNSEIKVSVDSHLTGLGVAGVAAMAIGIILLLYGSLAFAVGYPDKYRALGDVTIDESHRFIEQVVLSLSGGIMLLFLGSSMFFYGRTVLGSGHLDSFSTTETVQTEGGV